ncbi:FIG00452630: hypothetical protein [Burkholderia singularis]|uniref:DUF2844 domain-containing protein n=1 Tax=Burkholderia singularis TaxID=1503053 RepID=A0A238HBG3_9BURK|nr:FIG00452630: hypothetical protein [Burkholderia singularis]
MLRLNRSSRLAAIAAGFTGAWLVAALPAHAALGGAPITPPAADSAAKVHTLQRSTRAAGGSAAASAQAGYAVRETTFGSGTVVREYVSTAGTVFALSWRGPVVPNLSDLLGSYFPQYQAGVKASRDARGPRAPATIETSGLVVHTGGHMGAFSGQAWLPQSLPAGFSANDIQ